MLLAQSVYTKAGRAPNPAEWAHLRDEMVAGRRLLVLAQTDNGTAIGQAQINFTPKYSLFRRLNIPEIQDLLVAPDYRRGGIGAAMIKFCEDLIRDKGLTEAGISFGLAPSYGQAQRLYTKLGYVPDGSGAVYDRMPMNAGDVKPLDDNFCLMLIKTL